jgi:hypothetical protein
LKSRKIHTLILIPLLGLVFLATSVGGQIIGSKLVPSTGFVNVSSTVYYVVSKDGIYTVLSDSSGEIARNANAVTIINQAITLANTISGSVLITNGTYSLSSNINMKSNIAVYLQLGVTLSVTAFAPSSRQGIINFNGVTNARFVTATNPTSESSYPQVIGAATSNNEFGVLMSGTTYCTVGKINFHNIGGYGLCIYNSNCNVFNGTYVHGFVKVGGGYHMGVTIRWGAYNRLINIHADAELNPNANQVLYMGGEGPVTYNEIRGGIYENCGKSHVSYWCTESDATVPGDAHYGWYIDHNLCVGTIFRTARATGDATGLKLNTATNSHIGIDWDGTINPIYTIDCNVGFDMADGNVNSGGNHGNIVYANIINCRKGTDWQTQQPFTYGTQQNVQNNTVYFDVDGINSNYPMTGETGYMAFAFAGFWPLSGSLGGQWVQNNTIHLKARNCQYGVVFTGWDQPQSATQEARYNTFYLDVDNISRHAIYWMGGPNGCGGYGRWNTFYGYWRSTLPGNCPDVPNAAYVYSDPDVGEAVVATNTFNPS